MYFLYLNLLIFNFLNIKKIQLCEERHSLMPLNLRKIYLKLILILADISLIYNIPESRQTHVPLNFLNIKSIKNHCLSILNDYFNLFELLLMFRALKLKLADCGTKLSLNFQQT
ncbi:hypothetical protein BpHYR1_033718 [Brachionus plicatilis]|uniref:Uncharacterized protein n=1 Tax=Brachionus plicatilis TaxID=10195 RepID=A0A3M7QTH1_BRAPC|nr:hypothetical protein BpHYR1_033718 [Brachionus plicatilis]